MPVNYFVVQPAVCTGKDRLTQVQVGAQTSQGAALEWQIRWLQADPQSTIRLADERARELHKRTQQIVHIIRVCVVADQTIGEPYTLWGSVAGNVTAVKGAKFYVRGAIYGDLIVDPGGRCHVYGHVSGNLTSCSTTAATVTATQVMIQKD